MCWIFGVVYSGPVVTTLDLMRTTGQPDMASKRVGSSVQEQRQRGEVGRRARELARRILHGAIAEFLAQSLVLRYQGAGDPGDDLAQPIRAYGRARRVLSDVRVSFCRLGSIIGSRASNKRCGFTRNLVEQNWSTDVFTTALNCSE